MRAKTIAGVAGTTFATVSLAVVTAASAGAAPASESYGNQQKIDAGGTVTAWTVDGLHPSTDTLPVPVTGKLYEATATVQAVAGTATPVVTDFNARSAAGTNYRAVPAPTPSGVNPTPLQAGASNTGKIYFDVTGPAPESVVYNDGGQDLLVWK
ncbi:MPT63 family protein [Mycobacterium sp. BMJ-28]